MKRALPDPKSRDSASEVARSLKHLPAFTFALRSQDGTIESGPNPASVVELLECFVWEIEYNSPLPESKLGDQMAEAIERREQIIKTVQDQIAKLRQSGKWYALLWHAYGDTNVHYEHSDDSPAWPDVAERFAEDICSRLIAITTC